MDENYVDKKKFAIFPYYQSFIKAKNYIKEVANMSKANRNQHSSHHQQQQQQQLQQQQQQQVQQATERYNQLSSSIDESSPTTSHVPKPLSVDFISFHLIFFSCLNLNSFVLCFVNFMIVLH